MGVSCRGRQGEVQHLSEIAAAKCNRQAAAGVDETCEIPLAE
jgi:hypothetical protein